MSATGKGSTGMHGNPSEQTLLRIAVALERIADMMAAGQEPDEVEEEPGIPATFDD